MLVMKYNAAVSYGDEQFPSMCRSGWDLIPNSCEYVHKYTHIIYIYILSTGDLGVVQVYPMLGESRVIGLELRAACSILGPMSSGGLYF